MIDKPVIQVIDDQRREIAALKAKLAVAERVIETARLYTETEDRGARMLGYAIAAYDAAKEAKP